MKNDIIGDYFALEESDSSVESHTNVYTRDAILGLVNNLIKRNIPFCLAICDIDNFKNVNDFYGHLTGDKILKAFADFLKKTFKQGAIGRYGGDEFLVIVPNVTEFDDAWDLFHKFNVETARLNLRDLQVVGLTITTGIARYPFDGDNFLEIFDKADKALYRGKRKGRNCFVIYNHQLHANINTENDNLEFKQNVIDMHATIFDILSYKNSLKKNIRSLLRYLSTFIMADHVCIESNDKMLSTLILDNAPYYSFTYFPGHLMDHVMNNLGIYVLNQKDQLKRGNFKDILAEVERQKIRAGVWIRISAFGKDYGYLRAEMTTKYRIWQNEEVSILLTSARLIGYVLHYTNTDLDRVFNEV